MSYFPPTASHASVSGPSRHSPVRRGGALRKRWKDQAGNIFEWDSQHGTLEKYDRHGKHLGEYDPYSGERTKPADPTRRVEP